MEEPNKQAVNEDDSLKNQNLNDYAILNDYASLVQSMTEPPEL